MADFIYKILRESEWQVAHTDTCYAGSPDDIRDGFIHFSTLDQLAETAKRYFADEPSIRIIAFDPNAFVSGTLKWETSRNNIAFPHLYAPLDCSVATQHWCVAAGPDNSFDLTVLYDKAARS